MKQLSSVQTQPMFSFQMTHTLMHTSTHSHLQPSLYNINSKFYFAFVCDLYVCMYLFIINLFNVDPESVIKVFIGLTVNFKFNTIGSKHSSSS